MLSVTCQKTLSIAIGGGPVAWWPLEDPDPFAEVDIISSRILNPTGLGTGTSMPGRVNLGLYMEDGFGLTQQCPEMAYAGNGWSFVCWYKYLLADGVKAHLFEPINYVQDNTGNTWVSLQISSGFFTLSASIDGGPAGNPIATSLFPVEMAPLTWYFLFVSYDPSDGKFRLTLNDGALASLTSATSWAFPAQTYALSSNLTGSSSEALVDEVAWFPQPLNAAQVTYLYNGGGGRTWPVILPP